MEIHSVGIIGMGALGIMYGSILAEKKDLCDLSFIVDEARLQRYKNADVFCNGKKCVFSFAVPSEASEPVDLLLFSVKFGGLEEAVKTAAPLVGENTVCISTLNGITSEEVIARAYGTERTLVATVQGMDATKNGPEAEYHNVGNFALGTYDGKPSEKLTDVLRFFDKIGLNYITPDDMNRQLWNKLLLNDGINQAVAYYATNYAGVQKPGEPRQMMIDAMKEVVAIAQAKKINLTETDIKNWLPVIDSLDPNGMPSMRQDTLANRKTEVELFSGTMVRLGKELGIPTPVNDLFYDHFKALEKSIGD